MESDASSPSSEDSAADPQLASGRGPLGRLTGHVTGLSDDVRAWLELRWALAKIKLFERLDERGDELVLYFLVGAIGALGGLVLLLAASFGVSWIISAWTGWTIGALFLGFLVVAVLFFAVAGLFYVAKPRFGLFKSRTRATIPEELVTDGRAAGERASTSDEAGA